MAPELEVWLFADRVGTLALVEGRLNFRYTHGWLSRSNAVILSSSLPLQAEPFEDHQTRPFFAGLLPEGQMRRLIARQFQVSGQNERAGDAGVLPSRIRQRLSREALAVRHRILGGAARGLIR